MNTSKAHVVGDDLIPEFDFSRAIPSPYRDRARAGMRFHIRTDGADLPVYHGQAVPRGQAWWIEVAEIDGSGRSTRWQTIESTAREMIASSEGLEPTKRSASNWVHGSMHGLLGLRTRSSQSESHENYLAESPTTRPLAACQSPKSCERVSRDWWLARRTT